MSHTLAATSLNRSSTEVFPSSESVSPDPDPLRLPLLMPHDRIARRPLGVWADDLRDQLRRIQEGDLTPYQHLHALAPCANNVSLMDVYRGDIRAAEEMCRAQYRSAADAAAGDETLSAFCVQPWINLGRLYGRTGEPERALKMFQQLWNAARGEGTADDVPDWVVTGLEYLESGQDGGLRFCRSMYVLDSMQVMTFARLYDQLESFANKAPLEGWTRWHVAEGDLIAKAALDKLEQAAQNALSVRKRLRTWKKMSVLLHLSRILKRMGQTGTTHKILQQLMALCDQLPVRQESNVSHLFVIAEISEVALAAGHRYEIPDIAAAGLHAAQAIEDVPLQDRFHTMLLEVGESPSTHQAERDAMRLGSGYRRYGGADDERSTASMDALHEELLSHLQNTQWSANL